MLLSLYQVPKVIIKQVNQLPLHVDTSPYVPMPLVIYFIFCTNVRVLILFF